MYKSLQIIEPNRSHLVELKRQNLKPDFVRIRVKACGICGTDIHIFHGEYMGDYPIVPGHEFSGVIEEVGSNVKNFSVGDRVAVEPNLSCGQCSYCKQDNVNFCENWEAVGVTLPGGMSEYVDVPQSAVFNIGDLSFEEAAFMEPLSCCIHGIGKLNIKRGDTVALLGAGPIGLLLIQLIKYFGADQITVLDKNRERLRFAQDFTRCDVIENIDQLEKDNYDAVIDASGVIPLMEKSIEYVRKGGRILLFGVPPKEKKLNINAFTIFEKGLTISSSFTSVRNSEEAINLIETGNVKVKELISHKLPLDDFEKGVFLIEKGKENVRKILLIP